MSQSRNSVHEKLLKKLQAVKSKEPEADWLRDLVEWLYQEMLEVEFTDHLGAGPYERTPGRQGYRNGYRDVNCTHGSRNPDPASTQGSRGKVLHAAF